MNVYTYWVDQSKNGIPDYIKLCMRTWQRAISGITIEIINHQNLHRYLPETLLTPSFYRLSLAMQSDVVSIWVLLTRGGVFLDADTIMTKDPFSNGQFPKDKFSAFGYPQSKRIHLAVMSSPEPNHSLLSKWAEAIAERLSVPLPTPVPWDYVGNSIVNALFDSGHYSENTEIIDATVSGNILELGNHHEHPHHRYLDFYFTAPKLTFEEIVAKSNCGLISLHNSWTPDIYRNANLQELVKSKDSVLLSHLLINLCMPTSPKSDAGKVSNAGLK